MFISFRLLKAYSTGKFISGHWLQAQNEFENLNYYKQVLGYPQNLDPQSGPQSGPPYGPQYGPPSNGVNSFECSNVNIRINFSWNIWTTRAFVLCASSSTLQKHGRCIGKLIRSTVGYFFKSFSVSGTHPFRYFRMMWVLVQI